MIAKDVQPENEAAKIAVQGWRDVWWKTTFGGEDGTGENNEEPNRDFVYQVLDEFGGKLIELGRHVWRIQGTYQGSSFHPILGCLKKSSF